MIIIQTTAICYNNPTNTIVLIQVGPSLRYPPQVQELSKIKLKLVDVIICEVRLDKNYYKLYVEWVTEIFQVTYVHMARFYLQQIQHFLKILRKISAINPSRNLKRLFYFASFSFLKCDSQPALMLFIYFYLLLFANKNILCIQNTW